MTPEPHDEKACRRIREQLVSTAENLSVMNVGIAAAIRELERLRKENENPDAAKAFSVAIKVIQEKIQNPSAHVPLDIPDFQEPEVRAALETIANMTTEYAVERNCSVIEGEPDWEKIGFGMHPGIIANTFWTTEKKLAEKLYKEAKTGHLPIRIVCRYVTAPQPLEGEEQ